MAPGARCLTASSSRCIWAQPEVASVQERVRSTEVALVCVAPPFMLMELPGGTVSTVTVTAAEEALVLPAASVALAVNV